MSDLDSMWGLWLPRIPALLALLAGMVITTISFLSNRRRKASCLGATGFALLFILNILGGFTPLLTLRWTRGGMSMARAGIIIGIISLILALVDVVAIALLIVGVVLREPNPGEKV